MPCTIGQSQLNLKKLTTGQTLAGETIENIHGLAPLIHINSDWILLLQNPTCVGILPEYYCCRTLPVQVS